MPFATRRPREAVAFMRDQHERNSQVWRGMCQSSVRQAWGLPGGVASAKASLATCRALGKFHTWTNESAVPYGAPVWTDRPGGSTYGHIILAGGRDSSGRRIFWSVDITDSGGIDPVRIDAFRDRWGHVVLGWGSFLNGYDLPLKVKR